MQQSQSPLTINAVHDLEWSSSLSRACGQGAKFALLLAMLEQNMLQRPRLVQTDNSLTSTEPDLSHFYRNAPLQAGNSDFDNVVVTNRILSEQGISDARLWQSMHPDPLAVQSDAQFIDRHVIANMSFAAQQRYNHPQLHEFETDETGLYDVLQQVNPLN